MRMIYLIDATRRNPRQPWGTLVRLALAIAGAAVLLVIALIGLVVVLPLMLLGGIALYFYLRRRLRRAQERPKDGVIDADYTVIEHRE